MVALHDHHIKHRAAGGSDVEENVIKACGECHAKCHAGNIKLWQQVEIVARRLSKTPEEICESIVLIADKILPQDYVFEGQDNPLQGLSLDDVLQTYFSYEELGEEALWGKAQIMSGMIDNGLKPKTISSLLGCSPATIRERVRTYKAFPDESYRALDKSFTHHRIASKTDNPQMWIDMVCKEDLSTRQLEEAIKAEGKDEVIIKDFLQEKAERIIRMTKEVLETEEDAALWLKDALRNIIRSDFNDNNKILCVAADQANNDSQNDCSCAG